MSNAVKDADGNILMAGSQEAAEMVMGRRGSILIEDATVRVGPFCALKARGGDAVIDAVVMIEGGETGTNWLSGKTLKDGEIEYGPFASAKLTSGKLVAYLA